MIVSFGGKTPQDHGAAFVAPNATVLGDVILEAGSSVWYGAVLRGDDGTLTLGENTNVQDNAVLHCRPRRDRVAGQKCHGGPQRPCPRLHRGDGSLIGMHATLLNHCVIGKNCIIGAGALVPEGMVIPDGSVAVGVPARVIKTISAEQAAHNVENAQHYVTDAKNHDAVIKVSQEFTRM